MAIRQQFVIERDPEWESLDRGDQNLGDAGPWALTREQAESLYTDLGMALYPGGVGGADVPVQSGSVDLAAILASLADAGGPLAPSAFVNPPIEPDEAAMTPEQAAAALQVQAARGYDPLPHYTPGEGGSTFGVLHT